MKQVSILLVLLVGCALAQDMKRNAAASLFSDYKASRLGDAVTIYVIESSSATNQAETQAGRNSDLGITASGDLMKTTIPKTNTSIGTTNDFSGKGSTKSSGAVTTKISATIDSVLSNGNIRLKGSRKIVINGEEQVVSIRGIVRTSDISSDNVVYSYNITDAEIVFEGSGLIQRSQNPGLITKFLHWLF